MLSITTLIFVLLLRRVMPMVVVLVVVMSGGFRGAGAPRINAFEKKKLFVLSVGDRIIIHQGQRCVCGGFSFLIFYSRCGMVIMAELLLPRIMMTVMMTMMMAGMTVITNIVITLLF